MHSLVPGLSAVKQSDQRARYPPHPRVTTKADQRAWYPPHPQGHYKGWSEGLIPTLSLSHYKGWSQLAWYPPHPRVTTKADQRAWYPPIPQITTDEPPHDKTYKITFAPSEDSDQPGHSPSLISLHWQHDEALSPKLLIKHTAKTLIRLGGCPGWSESSLGTQIILLDLSRGISNADQRSFWICYLTACETLLNNSQNLSSAF